MSDSYNIDRRPPCWPAGEQLSAAEELPLCPLKLAQNAAETRPSFCETPDKSPCIRFNHGCSAHQRRHLRYAMNHVDEVFSVFLPSSY